MTTTTWQPAPILFPDAELLLTTGFRALLVAAGESDVVVDRKVPNPRPPRLVAITRDGGTTNGLRDEPRMRFRIYDESEQKVNDLARKVCALAPKLVQNGTVTKVIHQSGPYEVADQSKTPMRYALIEFHTRGTAI